MTAADSDALSRLFKALERGAERPTEWTEPRASNEDLRRAWEASSDALLLARLASRAGSLAECAAAEAAVILWGLRFLSAHDAPKRAAATLEAWTRGEEAIAALDTAMDEIQKEGDGLDYATRMAFEATRDALWNVADYARGNSSPQETLEDSCACVIRAAGLRDWDELLAEAAFCDAAPWPNPEYDAMSERREAAERAAHAELAAILRAHIAWPAIEAALSAAFLSSDPKR
jgi:hypothetical protein